MRQLHVFQDHQLAVRFFDVLSTKQIGAKLKQEPEGFEIWVIDDDQLTQANSVLKDFLNAPNQPEFIKAHQTAKKQREEAAKEFKEWQKNTQFKVSIKKAYITMVLIGISVFISIITFLGDKTDPVKFLYITDYQITGPYMYYAKNLSEIWHGQIWRLFTPMFLHFGILHIVFNMLWLKDLGTIIELKHGKWYFLALTLTIAALSNISQFYWSGPLFGGMSGVVYGHLGFLWMRGRFDPYYRLILNKNVVIMMVVWLFLCMTGILGPIANAAHVVGLLAGMVWGYLSSGHIKRLLK